MWKPIWDKEIIRIDMTLFTSGNSTEASPLRDDVTSSSFSDLGEGELQPPTARWNR
jgi:hypothetical protein